MSDFQLFQVGGFNGEKSSSRSPSLGAGVRSVERERFTSPFFTPSEYQKCPRSVQAEM